MTRIAIDADLCQGTGECVALAPGAIVLDDLGIAHATAELPDDLAARVVVTCPSMAISLVAGGS